MKGGGRTWVGAGSCCIKGGGSCCMKGRRKAWDRGGSCPMPGGKCLRAAKVGEGPWIGMAAAS